MIVALLCAAMVAQTQDPPRITIEQRALRADVALRKIGEEFGVKLVPDESTKNDVLLVYLPEVTFEEFRNKTANGWNAQWKETDDGWELQRTKDQEQKETDAYIASRIEHLGELMARWIDLSELSELDADRLANFLNSFEKRSVRFSDLRTLERRGSSTDTLGSRALRRFLTNIGPEELAKLTGRQYLVFESGQGKYSSPVLDEILRSYERENSRIRRALSQIGRLKDLEEQVDEYGPVNLLKDSLRVTKGVSKLVIKMTVESGFVLWPYIYAFDESGELLFSDSEFLFTIGRNMNFLPLKEPLDLTISPTAAEIKMYYDKYPNSFDYGDEEALELRKTVLFEALKNMPEEDELSYEPSEVLITFCKSQNLALVARLSDGLQSGSTVSKRKAQEGDDYAQRILHSSSSLGETHFSRIDSENEMLVIEPITPARFRARFPREEIAEFCKRAGGSLGVNVYDLGRLFAATSDYDVLDQIDHIGSLVPAYAWNDNGGNWLRYAILGALSATNLQIARSQQGVTVRLSSLPKIVHRALDERFTYTSFTHQLLDFDTRKEMGFPGEERIENLVAMALPQGVPANSLVNVRLVDKPYVFTENPDKARRSMDLSDIAREYGWLEVDEETDRDKWLAKVPFHIGSAVEMTVRVDMGAAVSQNKGDVVISLGTGRTYKFTDLPTSVQKQFWEMTKEDTGTIELDDGLRSGNRP